MGDPQVATRSQCTTGAPHGVETRWTTLDGVCSQEIFKQRFAILQGCPAHLKARYRLTTVLEAVHTAVLLSDLAKEIRGWKLFIVLPFWLLRRPFSRGRVGRQNCPNVLIHSSEASGCHSQPLTGPQYLRRKQEWRVSAPRNRRHFLGIAGVTASGATQRVAPRGHRACSRETGGPGSEDVFRHPAQRTSGIVSRPGRLHVRASEVDVGRD